MVSRAVTAACTAAVGVLVLVLSLPLLLTWVLGWQIVEVEGGSMMPTYSWGDVIVIDAGARTLVPGTVVTVRRPDGVLYTHRVVTLNADGSAITRGDANPIPDRQPVVEDDVVGVVVTHIDQPWADAVAASQSIGGRVSLGALLAGLLVLPVAARLTVTGIGSGSRASRTSG